MEGYFIIQCIQTMGKTRIFAALSFPFAHFNLNTLKVNDHAGHVISISTMNMSHIVKATEQNLMEKLLD